MMSRVLLIDDSVDCQMMVSRALQDAMQVSIAPNLTAAKEMLEKNSYDLLLLDVSLPDGDGFNFCSSYLAHQHNEKRPRIVFLTGAESISERITGFKVGADDYVVKPFEPLEFKARLQAHLRNHNEQFNENLILKIGNLVLDMKNMIAQTLTGIGPQNVDLTPVQFRLLFFLAKNEGYVRSREQLLAALLRENLDVSDRAIDVQLCRIRKKLFQGQCTHTIEAVYGIGYRMVQLK